MKLKKKDTVKVLIGKDKGKTGEVIRLMAKQGQALVQGINMFKKHLKKRGNNQGGIVDIPKPLNLAKLGLVCPNCKKVTRVGFKTVDGRKFRFCKHCQEEIK